MKKILAISLIALGSFASVGVASAESIATIHYDSWAVSAFNISGDG